MPPIIRVQNLGKHYQLGLTHAGSIREVVNRITPRLFRAKQESEPTNGHHRSDTGTGTFWALKDVSFEVWPGEVVGVIGRNGAGKSTLLKILSRITSPTKGRVELFGRVASLLEVGTGFHPELTGRENIFLNGAILGMSKAEIRRKFDEIVSFAEVEQFIETPVKRYSSGMYVRLAFAVAAHLEPEILIVDEVLAVGDVKFQAKCLGKMQDVAGSGRTVLFVSHNMGAVQSLCSRCLYLREGAIAADDTTENAIAAYLRNFLPTAMSLSQRTDREGNGAVRFEEVQVLGATTGSKFAPVVTGGPLRILLDVRSDTAYSAQSVEAAVAISDRNGNRVTTFATVFVQAAIALEPPLTQFVCEIDELPLAPGEYSLYLWIAINGKTADRVENAARFTVHESDFYGSGRIPDVSRHGALMVRHRFSRTRVYC
jgi:lipopolysaccharide transport system ATP-binding protein